MRWKKFPRNFTLKRRNWVIFADTRMKLPELTSLPQHKDRVVSGCTASTQAPSVQTCLVYFHFERLSASRRAGTSTGEGHERWVARQKSDSCYATKITASQQATIDLFVVWNHGAETGLMMRCTVGVEHLDPRLSPAGIIENRIQSCGKNNQVMQKTKTEMKQKK